ncbi:hypothetical protein PRECH8_03160 [Insulibacter thermoxylanivorax]|uniref:6-phosphogluconolactonase n=1 Tax=Insulibacter thermoxylanivorax TaxID=2749268 RepID=A0A916QAA5_9BACL|nr:lactonase family protein [Insulibacter thermoxylanivorax]GFR37020.1 hypothetical protein PRECH8_03160 [Insulibacter thermoxylanivorax]
MSAADTKQLFAYIGSYADPSGPGIYACIYDTETGQLKIQSEVSGLQDPTFLAVDRENRKLYSIGSVMDEQGKKTAEAYAFQITEEGNLSLLNKQPTIEPTCHITLDATKRSLIVSSYHGGTIGICPIEADGTIGPIREVHQHEGSSVHPNQQSPHPHSVFIDRNNRYAVCCDLGIDQIIIYKLDAENSRLIPHSRTAVQPGAGPRHFAFHPAKPYGYVINELDSTVNVYEYDEEAGTLKEIQSISTLPSDYSAADNACADIHISKDGRFLYGSNRGHDSIVVYAINPDSGRLTLVEHVSTEGRHPRNFALSPDDRYLLAANRDTNNIVTFARDAETGTLQATGFELSVSKPVCIKFMA